MIVLAEALDQLNIEVELEKNIIEIYIKENANNKLSIDKIRNFIKIHRITNNYYNPEVLPHVYEYVEKPDELCSCSYCKNLIEESKPIIEKLKIDIHQKKLDRFRNESTKFLKVNKDIFENKKYTNKFERIFIKKIKKLADKKIDNIQKNNFFQFDCNESRTLKQNFIDMKTILLERKLKKSLKNELEDYSFYYNVIEKEIFKKPYQSVKQVIKQYLRDQRKLKEHVQISPKKTNRLKRLLNRFIDYRNYQDFFVKAREMNRNIIFYNGETCSGKTYLAHNVLSQSKSGLYLAPLRLLALEGQEEQAKRGIISSYLTGDDKEIIEGATHKSSTIEMLNLSKPVETAVIDEIQLLGDPQRGWAWSQALLGVPAKNIILTGSSNAVNIVKEIAEILEEPIEIHELKRLTELIVMKKPVTLDDIQKKDCIVAFSRKDVLNLKNEIEQSGMKVSVIYGGLPPEVRREESKRFNKNITDVLVATDAIAMGLNLPIRRVIFYTTTKFFNRKHHPLSISEIRQIGGRAGRYGKEKYGYVTAFNNKDIDRIRNAFNSVLPDIKQAHILPTIEHIKIISEITGVKDIEVILKYFQRYVKINNDILKLADLKELLYKAKFASKIKDLELAFTFTVSPADIKNRILMKYFKDFVKMMNDNRKIPAPVLPKDFQKKLQDINSLRDLEDYIKLCNLYNWLHYRYPKNFIDLENSNIEKAKAVNLIIKTLSEQNLIKRCRICGRVMELSFEHFICDICFHKKRHLRKY